MKRYLWNTALALSMAALAAVAWACLYGQLARILA